MIGLRFGNHLSQEIRFEGNFNLGSSSGFGFFSMEIGLDFRLLPDVPVTPIFNFGGGLIHLLDYNGFVGHFTFGIDVNLDSNTSMRFAFRRSKNTLMSGPHSVNVGVEFRM